MSTKMKGFFKGFKYISQIFVYKEHEMEIGYPTDVRHVAHIGWDSSPLNAPSWMNEFKTTSDFSTHSLSSFGQSRETSWASQESDQARAEPRAAARARGAIGAAASQAPSSDIPRAPKKAKRKKAKQRSPSASSSSRSTTRSSRSRDSFATAVGEGDPIPVESG